eukprot:TRINITY_DN18144_c0_g1_i2.p1 TRINITY_DN18144_c0_g1~~TRINITY_DN18144_c0_g1_i2.p1  ORF type:complete len:1046 (-),score=144.88 TRINITY_DN18144_c0_g1_i2:726-3863(-)
MTGRAAKANQHNLLDLESLLKAPYSEQLSFVTKLQPVWSQRKRYAKLHPCKLQRSDVLALVDDQSKLAKTSGFTLCLVAFAIFGKSGDPFAKGPIGIPHLHATIMCMADKLFELFRPLLAKYGFEDTLSGYAAMDEAILERIAQQDSTLMAAHLRTWHHMVFGETEQGNASIRKMFAVMLASPGPVMTATSQSFLSHLALPPLERSESSAARTIAFVQAYLGSLLTESKRIVWILGATVSELSLARQGLFDDSAAFLTGHQSIKIVLVGDFKTSEEIVFEGLVQVSACNWDKFHAKELSDPNLVFLFNTGLGTLVPDAMQRWLRLLVDLLTYQPKSGGVGIPVVLTCRCEEEARGEQALIARLAARSYLPSISRGHLRNLYSSMAGSPRIDFDENGWLVSIKGSKLDATSLQKFVERNPADLCNEIAADLKETSLKHDSVSDAMMPEMQKSAAVYWGILDLKYDPDQPLKSRVKVLELGDGRASKFSGYGAAIKESFNREHRLDKNDAVNREVMVEDKKLTHDMINESGYVHLQPKQLCFPKKYTSSLAEDIRSQLGMTPDDICILKLSNRARSAGIIPLFGSELDERLKLLLEPPNNIEKWFDDRSVREVLEIPWGCSEEQVRHWWANDNPFFVVEEFCRSKVLHQGINDGEKCSLDGTMRVGFSLHRGKTLNLPLGWEFADGRVDFVGHQEGDPPEHTQEEVEAMLDPFIHIFPLGTDVIQICWLGGYWKLPLEENDSTDLRGRIVSVAKKGTAPVAKHELHQVYAAMGDFVQQIFQSTHKIGAMPLLKRYAYFPELAAFLVARLACSMRKRDFQKGTTLLNLARTKIDKIDGRPRDLALSYILRNLGIVDAIQGRWDAAKNLFDQSLELMPSNATARYLLGLYELEQGNTREAIRWMEQSLLLDLDFRAPYANLGLLYLQSVDIPRTIAVSKAGLERHPQLQHCLYHLAVASFASWLVHLRRPNSHTIKLAQEAGYTEASVRAECLASLRELKQQNLPAHVWTEREDRMLAALENPTPHRPDQQLKMDDLAKAVWRFNHWRS